MNPTPSQNVFWVMLGRIFVQLLGERAHAQIVITVKDGAIQPIHINRTYLANDLPKV